MSEHIADLDVLMLTQYYIPEPIGTAPYAADLAQWLVDQGARVQVLTNRPYYPGTEVLPTYQDGSRDRETLESVPIVRVKPLVPQRGGPLGHLAADVLFFLKGVTALVRGHITRRHHVVSFCPSIFTVLLGWVAAGKRGRHIAVMHDIESGLAAGLGFPAARLFVRALRRFEAFVLNRADTVVVLAPEMKTQLARLGVTCPIEVIPIWVDTAAIYPLPDDPERAPTLLYSGNLGRKQGLGMVLDLAARVARTRSDVRVLIRGMGSQADAILAEARSRKLANVTFVPLLPKEQLNVGLAEADVHLVPQDPSAADFALPSKLYTILATGRPVVATAQTGSALWRLAEETGALICVPPGDVDAFAQCALELIDNKERRRELGAIGREYAQRFATREIVLSNYAKLIGNRA